jgi:stage II sporulation protein AB (anti-sigma F factor)
MNATNYMKLEMRNKAENVGVARVALASFASQLDFTVSELEEIKVAVSEAVSNAVIHAYQGEGIIEVTGLIYPNNVFEVSASESKIPKILTSLKYIPTPTSFLYSSACCM